MLYKVESKLKSEILVNVQVNITKKRESYCAAYSNAFHCITGYTTSTMIYRVLFLNKMTSAFTNEFRA